MAGPYKRMSDVPQFTRDGGYTVTVPWLLLESGLAQLGEATGLDLDPDFQRGHVWSDDQRVRYVEFVLRGGRSSRLVMFNQSGWQNHGADRGEPTTLVDGKQRLEAVRMFMRGELEAFGSSIDEFEDKPSITSHNFTFMVNDLATRKEVLAWYIDLNSGGIAHSTDEIDRVRKLLDAENG
jgi:hypothetical protein